ncbi:hypothetical protein DB88DRAFT_505539 [Papiliotrema laurentii]|uniref:TatD related DNase n=1 Tax=Papiliotrema laurentii TaxID=5418 RepID=A0AAD9CX96_PAPLA|nr:hypothetical protein DB88DRAFT_505539 [Papiliotrema laurentii]
MTQLRFADIAVNLTDPQFIGSYHGRVKHASDLDDVVDRARSRGVEKMLITGTSLSESRGAVDMAKSYQLHCTAGCHPTSTGEIAGHQGGQEGYIAELVKLVEEDRRDSRRIIAIGEVGLDYDRLHFASRQTQQAHLPALLLLSKRFHLPLFLHSRHPEAHTDLVAALNQVGWDAQTWPGAVVHSFTGTISEVDELVRMGLYIGLNGCSLKTPENLSVVKDIPLDRLLIETDAPWCSITTSHASHAHLPQPGSPLLLEKVNKPEKHKPGAGVKGRMEPCEVPIIAQVIANVKGISLKEVAHAAWSNTLRLFYPEEIASTP